MNDWLSANFLGVLALLAGSGSVVTVWVQNRGKKIRTPADEQAAENAANDLIMRLLDRANAEITRYEALIARLTNISEDQVRAKDELITDIRRQLNIVTRERDRLISRISFLREKARATGHLTYAEIVSWASNALDPDAPIDVVYDNAGTGPVPFVHNPFPKEGTPSA